MSLAEPILVTGLARNVEHNIEKEIERIEKKLAEIQLKSDFLVIESDSNDNTVQKLSRIRDQRSNFEFVSLNSLELNIPNRIERLTYCRNLYVDHIRKNFKYKDIKFVMIVDFDLKNNRLDLQVLKQWLNLKNWSALFANQSGLYYDIFALRKSGWCEKDCFIEYFKLQKYFYAEVAKELAIWSKMVRIPKNSGPIKVQSAFGGLGIYKKEIFLNFDYSPPGNNFTESEHVILHKKIDRNFGELYILPNLINFSWNPHNLSRFRTFRMLDRHMSAKIFLPIRKLIRKQIA